MSVVATAVLEIAQSHQSLGGTCAARRHLGANVVVQLGGLHLRTRDSLVQHLKDNQSQEMLFNSGSDFQTPIVLFPISNNQSSITKDIFSAQLEVAMPIPLIGQFRVCPIAAWRNPLS